MQDLDHNELLTPPLVAAAGWLVPGLGYWLIGERSRAMIAGIAITVLFVMGILISGVRCIDVPGFDAKGAYQTGSVTSRPIPTILEKPWYIPQILAGPLTIGSSFWSVRVADNYPKATARMFDIGTLYTAIAGMLNLLVIIDSAYRGAKK
jgi:hypothetical protein